MRDRPVHVINGDAVRRNGNRRGERVFHDLPIECGGAAAKQAMADQPRRRTVEDAMHQEAAGARDAGDDFGEVGGAPGGQRAQRT